MNKKFTGECIQEANRFANLAVQHVDSQNSKPGAWGVEIGSDELVMMAVVLGQFDFGHEAQALGSFPIGKIDFNPPRAPAKSVAKKGGKRRNSRKRKSNKRKSIKKRKTIRRK